MVKKLFLGQKGGEVKWIPSSRKKMGIYVLKRLCTNENDKFCFKTTIFHIKHVFGTKKKYFSFRKDCGSNWPPPPPPPIQIKVGTILGEK